MIDGRVDCILGAATTPEFLRAREQIERPFESLDGAQRDYYRETGIFPIVHLVVCREAFLEDADHRARLCATFESPPMVPVASFCRHASFACTTTWYASPS